MNDPPADKSVTKYLERIVPENMQCWYKWPLRANTTIPPGMWTNKQYFPGKWSRFAIEKPGALERHRKFNLSHPMLLAWRMNRLARTARNGIGCSAGSGAQEPSELRYAFTIAIA